MADDWFFARVAFDGHFLLREFEKKQTKRKAIFWRLVFVDFKVVPHLRTQILNQL